MKQYRVYFLNGDILVLSQNEWNHLSNTVVGDNGAVTLPFYSSKVNGRDVGIRIENVNYYESEEIEGEAADAIITPPSPTEVRAEKEEAATNTPTNLDDQLNNPNLGES